MERDQHGRAEVLDLLGLAPDSAVLPARRYRGPRDRPVVGPQGGPNGQHSRAPQLAIGAHQRVRDRVVPVEVVAVVGQRAPQCRLEAAIAAAGLCPGAACTDAPRPTSWPVSAGCESVGVGESVSAGPMSRSPGWESMPTAAMRRVPARAGDQSDDRGGQGQPGQPPLSSPADASKPRPVGAHRPIVAYPPLTIAERALSPARRCGQVGFRVGAGSVPGRFQGRFRRSGPRPRSSRTPTPRYPTSSCSCRCGRSRWPP